MNAQSIGWTLIHSLWQGLAIYIVLRIAIRFTNRADVKYGLGVAAMALMLVCSVGTFLSLGGGSGSTGFDIIIDAKITAATNSASFIQTILQFIDQNIIWLIRFWMMGFVVGLLRIATGLWYIGRLRRNAHPVQEEWMNMVNSLSGSLNVNRVVAMAEASISSPMVVGFMKPIILFPVGLLSGLSTEQVETILVHELSHIRRQDYIINLVQSVIETIFFFNPFTLLISSMIREERENCCDDMVIAKGVNPISYVRTLAQLEAARSSTSLAMGFTGNQNQLLNRIKRIMENSAKNDWGKGRLVPVALLFLGLVCASWLSISSEKEIQSNQKTAHNVLATDTSKEDGLKVIKRGRGSNAWMVEPLEPMEPADAFVPDFEFIEPMEPIDMDISMDMDFEIPPMPEMPMVEIPFEYGDFGDWDGSISTFEFHGPDSIPSYTFRLRNPVDLEQFEREFTEKFKTQFKDFYDKNQGEFKKLMEDAKREETTRREAAETVDLAQLQRKSEMDHVFSRDAIQFQKQALDMVQLQKQGLEVMNQKIQEQKFMVEDILRSTEEYKIALTEMLAEDGYIKKGDDLDGIHINDMNGEMTINGNKIKEKDQVKYRALRDTFFPGKQRMSRDTYRRQE